jgi:hypothetical protein
VGEKNGLEAGEDVRWLEQGEHLAQRIHEPHTLPRVQASRHRGPVYGVYDLAGVGTHAVRAVAGDVFQRHGGR